MDCPHCRAALPEGAHVCPACGVDLLKLKARDALARLKREQPPEQALPAWVRPAVFLCAMALGACLLLYGASRIAGRSSGRGDSSQAASPPPAATAPPAPEPAPFETAREPLPSVPEPPSPSAAPVRLKERKDGTWEADSLPVSR